MTLQKANKDCKALWRHLSVHSDPELDEVENKRKAMIAVGIDPKEYENDGYCPYCKYDRGEIGCGKCPIFIEYGAWCKYIGYGEWEENRTPENAMIFYNNIKGL